MEVEMATYELQRKCAICGATIGDQNPDGFGGECRPRYRKEALKRLFSNEDWKHKYYLCEVNTYLKWMEDYSSKHTFRSAFKKSFIPSVIEQMKTKGFLSRKQKEIIESMLQFEPNRGQFAEDVDKYINDQHNLIDDFVNSISPKERGEIVECVIKSYRMENLK